MNIDKLVLNKCISVALFQILRGGQIFDQHNE